ncbi:hypothetical protein GGS21DRAFT_524203 [Xylaria nigripes]|nr:hypothetical protein GGS21DRAFT_524203 [Xylaria nigripes]
MLGVDYSPQSVQFARRLERSRRNVEEEEGGGGGGGDDDDDAENKIDVHFAEHDILHTPASALLNATFSPDITHGWDVLLDKGTFDAVSLSAETLEPTSASDEGPRRINEAYGSKILPLIREGGLFLITSCNWVEAELKAWFEDGAVQEMSVDGEGGGGSGSGSGSVRWCFETVGRIEYRSFSFGGVKGQTISTLCFRKVRKSA